MHEDHGPSGSLIRHDSFTRMTSAAGDLLEFGVARTFNFLSPEIFQLYERTDTTAFQNSNWKLKSKAEAR